MELHNFTFFMLCIVKPKGWKSDNNIWHRSKQAADTLLHEKNMFQSICIKKRNTTSMKDDKLSVN